MCLLPTRSIEEWLQYDTNFLRASVSALGMSDGGSRSDLALRLVEFYSALDMSRLTPVRVPTEIGLTRESPLLEQNPPPQTFEPSGSQLPAFQNPSTAPNSIHFSLDDMANDPSSIPFIRNSGSSPPRFRILASRANSLI